MENITCDVAVIGGGPGGYVAAIKSAQLGKKTILIENKDIGGVCLNRGCIPTKCLVAHAHTLSKVKKAQDFGIHVENISYDFEKIQNTKDTVVKNLRTSLEGLIKANGVQIIRGFAKFSGPKELKVQGEQNSLINAEKIIIATGSHSTEIPAFPFDQEKILDSTAILNIKKVPKTLAIIGGGYIGCEFACFFAELGVKVMIFEALPTILTQNEPSVVQLLLKSFAQKGIEVFTNVKVQAIPKETEGVKVVTEDKEYPCDMALVSVGRRVDTQSLDLDKAGVAIDPKGYIVTNDKMETNVPHIYAIGDVTGKWMLAHTASHQGIVAAQNASGKNKVMHYNAVPAVIFTRPEIASVGMTSQEATKKGHKVASAQFPFQALGIAHAYLEKEGFVQMITDEETGQLLGAHIIGANAGTLIAELALAIHNELTLECIFDTIHAHPTFPEAIMEAAFLANKTPLHLPKR